MLSQPFNVSQRNATGFRYARVGFACPLCDTRTRIIGLIGTREHTGKRYGMFLAGENVLSGAEIRSEMLPCSSVTRYCVPLEAN
ncbi:branched-chain amino acid ABC transporter ATP-binding protein [Anopheles sinensis]|uniref:Branched-chain amino acid ABC transporter ATP-binding protein n=1 Tax=Anopheles sinensis TaxID=74873 RepID=A0A084VQK2_ANOSI|nr:branched-chain amino acid ABC transporter ATP-binding protein [Anopheles sinensis]